MARNGKKGSESKQNVIDIPDAFLDGRVDIDSKVAVVLAFAKDLDLDMSSALAFVENMRTFQEHSEHKFSTGWGLKIDEIEILDIRIGKNKDFLLGRKARIHFKDKGWKSDKVEEQFIDTEWIEFFGNNPERVAFSVAVANKLYETAQDILENNDGNAYVRKHYFEDDDDGKFRYLSYIRESYEDQGSSNSGGSRRRGSGGGRRGGANWSDQVEEAINSLSRADQKQLNSDDQELFEDLSKSEESDIDEAVAEHLGIKKRELATVDDYDNLADYAVKLLVNSIPEED